MKVLIIFLLIPLTVMATEYRTGESVRVPEADTLYSDLFVGAKYLDVYGYVDGDIYAGCERVTIEGEVEDDIRAAGKEIVIRGMVGDGVLSMSGYLLIEGVVQGDVIAFGGQVKLAPSAHVKGNIFIGCGEFTLDGGRVGGNITGGAGQVFLNGTVKGAVDLEVDEISFGADQIARGGTRIKLERDIDAAEIANAPADLDIVVKPKRFFIHSVFFFWSFLAALIVGALIIAFAKNHTRDYMDLAVRTIGKNIGIGLLIVFVVPIAVVILLLMILTIPVGLITLATYLVLLYLSSILTALVIGDYIQKLWHKNGPPLLFLSLLFGLIAVFLLTEVPLIGWLISLAVISFGSGSLILYIWNLTQVSEETQ